MGKPLTSILCFIVLLKLSNGQIHQTIEIYVPSANRTKLDMTSTAQLQTLDKSLGFCKTVNLLETTIVDLQSALSRKSITSLELCRCYITRIQRMDPHLNSVLELNPDAEKIAKEMDKIRDSGVSLGPMHGIPILVKDNIATGDNMETTAGSLAMMGIRPKYDSNVVKLLRKAGVVLLGKANMDEFAFNTVGVSGRGGKTSNAYVLSRSSSGSSCGSAVSVAANLIPVALGTETDGSIVFPSRSGSLAALKTSHGRVSTKGIIPLSRSQDVIGPIARTVSDASILFSIISRDGFKNKCYSKESVLEKCLDMKFKVGVLRIPHWISKYVTEEQLAKLEQILKMLPSLGIKVEDPIWAPSGTMAAITIESESITESHEFKADMNEYLATKVRNNSVMTPSGIKTIQNVADIIAFNAKTKPAFFVQEILALTEVTDGLQNTTYEAERDKNKGAAQIFIDYVFLKHSLDAVVVPSGQTHIPALAGYPYITVPAGFDSSNMPFGISFYGLPKSDEKLLIIGRKVEAKLGARRSSNFLP